MRFLVWLGCLTVCLNGLELSLYVHDGWRWLWIPLLVLYFFAGVGLLLFTIAKVVAGKSGVGALSGFRTAKPPAPTPPEEE